jgi:GTP-binding protein LepA
MNKMRNFCIIAHIDHGKSTLADRIIELTGAMGKREMKHAQLLDTMELEQEKGITIKLQPIRMSWKGVEMNLIDTPGHVDFTYEVSRSLACVEGAVLVVDATQGIEAQTLSNVYLAMEQDLVIIPVLNKIDLPNADVPRITEEIVKVLGYKKEDIICVSAKTGMNVEALLDAVIERIPSPSPKNPEYNRALIFDSTFDIYRGIIAYVRVIDGRFQKGDEVHFLGTGYVDEIIECGYFTPKLTPKDCLENGEIGYIITGTKDINQIHVGDTVAKEIG